MYKAHIHESNVATLLSSNDSSTPTNVPQSFQNTANIASTPDSLLLPNTRLKLYPFLVWRKNAKDYFLMRLGCRKVTVVSTSHQGAVASRLLQRGYSTAEVTTRLSSLLQCNDVNMEPLLKALYKGRMVRSINSQTIEPEVPSLKRELQQRLECVQIRARGALSRIFIRNLPVPISHPIMCFLRAKRNSKNVREARAQAKRNLESVFGNSLSQKQIQYLVQAFIQEKIGRETDLQLLSELPEMEAGKWLRRYCVFHGLEHLDAALAKQQGVLLSSFHFSSSHLLVLLLWLHGYSFTGAGGIPWNNRNRVLPSDNAELARQLKGCGNVKWYATFTLESALAICRAINQGGIGLVFPDGHVARAVGDVARHFGHDAAAYKRAQCQAPFLGRVAQANTGVPWIYQQSKAPLIPIKLIRDSFHRFQVIVGPEVKLDRTASLEKITADLYGTLEHEIRLDPAAWIYWNILDQFTTTS